MKTDKIYAIRDEDENKLVSDLTSTHKKYWDRRKSAEAVIRRNRRYRPTLKLVTFQLVELTDQEENK
jgi:hypothetical protein